MIPLLLILFSHSIMIMVCASFYSNLFFALGVENDCWLTHYNCNSQLQEFFDYNFTAIYIIGMFVVFFLALCIIFEMKKIQNEEVEQNFRIYNEKALLNTESYSNHV